MSVSMDLYIKIKGYNNNKFPGKIYMMTSVLREIMVQWIWSIDVNTKTLQQSYSSKLLKRIHV